MSDQTDFQNCVRLVCSKCDMKPLENHHTRAFPSCRACGERRLRYDGYVRAWTLPGVAPTSRLSVARAPVAADSVLVTCHPLPTATHREISVDICVPLAKIVLTLDLKSQRPVEPGPARAVTVPPEPLLLAAHGENGRVCTELGRVQSRLLRAAAEDSRLQSP